MCWLDSHFRPDAREYLCFYSQTFDESAYNHSLMPKISSKLKAKPERREAPPAHEEMQTTAIHITKDDWSLLRSVAFSRAQASGGRASVSDVVRTLIAAHRDELQREVDKG